MILKQIHAMEKKRKIDYNLLYEAFSFGGAARGVAKSILRHSPFSQQAFDQIKEPHKKEKRVLILRMSKEATSKIALSNKQKKEFLNDGYLSRVLVFNIKPHLTQMDFRKLLNKDNELHNWVWSEGIRKGFKPNIYESEKRLDSIIDTFQVGVIVKNIPKITKKLEIFLLQHMERHLTQERILMCNRQDYKPSIRKIKFILQHFERREFKQSWELKEMQAWADKLLIAERLKLMKKYKTNKNTLIEAL